MIMMEQDEVEAHQVDLDLEPQSRPRSCTWPLRCPDHSPCVPELNGDLSLNLAVFKVEPDNVPSSCRLSRRRMLDAGGLHGLAGSALDVAGQLRKTKSSRRNAWGNQSYAELITRAIESTPDKRLTLSQIYDWMVRYVPYFKDKGDSNSSAGWKNSIRHNLSLHTRFIRVQNEGTGKSSWWMLNPEGGKAGKAPRRRAASMDNSTKYLKTKGRVSRKRTAGKSTQGGGLVPAAQVEFCSSPEHCSPPRKLRTGVAVVREEFEVWTDLHSCASSSASLSGRLSPILAEGEQVEPEDGRMSCSTSPHLYPSPSSIHSPASHCPADLRALLSLEDFYQQPHNHPSYHYNSKSKGQGSTCGPVHGLSGVGVIHHHSTMQTIQENKATRFSGSKQSYSGTSTLQSLLTRGPQFCVNDMILKKEMIASNNRVDSSSHHHNHSNNQYHSQICSSNISFKSFHSHNTIQSLSQESVHSQPSGGHMQPYVNKANYIYSPTAHAHLPASTTLPPNPAGVKGISQDTSHLATAPHRHPSTYTDPHPHNMTDGPYHQPQGAAGGYHNFHHPNQLYPHERLPADLDMDIFYNSLDCDMESILLHDFLDSGEEIDFNFDASLVQGMGIGFGQQNHSKQSWVPG